MLHTHSGEAPAKTMLKSCCGVIVFLALVGLSACFGADNSAKS